MKTKTFLPVALLFLSMCMLQAFGQHKPAANQNGMLILGSADMKTLVERVEVGYKLYASSVPFDYIIVSGGCAAHASAICEASEMASRLIAKGVPAEIIFKEEKSKTTVQNYAYSRALRKPDGTKVISPGDTLYVVSNHWHAIAVAARFTANDSVTARYHIEGGILPKNTDKVNYTNIYDPQVSSEDFSAKALWPIVEASFTVEKGKKQQASYRFVDGAVYTQSPANGPEAKAVELAQALPAIPADWAGALDAAFYNSREKKVYLFKGGQYARFTPQAKTLDAGYPKPLSALAKGLPENWQQGYLDAAFFNPSAKEIFLFKGSEYLQVPLKGKGDALVPKQIKTLVADWPFSWGSGDLDAADYSSQENKVYLYRGQEYVVISLEGSMNVAPGYPKKTEVARPVPEKK
ncbi:hemopexin repeat-containing protein [Pontibacter mangrovi]|uniref:DUF218 domain-containing protein n=1 Tax=Pontibacter mangrovi TaxID=2589816 RepID=A0A501W2J3_9BACT|nr:hemopexin repeat-containing protein [Pontibacter mangrovi]TPE41027.1 hypothetical protein FJM65_19470 [Pontibacter mangrovi]